MLWKKLHIKTDWNENLLNYAMKSNLIGVMLSLMMGANINHHYKNGGYTALMWASHRDNISMIRYLFKKGADVNIRTHTGINALLIAAQLGKDKAVICIVDCILKYHPKLTHLSIPYVNDKQRKDYPHLFAADDHGLLNYKQSLQ